MNVYNKLIKIYLTILNLIINLFSIFNVKEIEIQAPKTIKIITKEYADKYNDKFLKMYEETDDIQKMHNNLNIANIFYSKKLFQEMLNDTNNPLEKEWKTRILLETTPRGNIIMYYDPYKLGFTYYCDQFLPYDILNTVAMKYVVTFQCHDFFMDEHIIPENKTTPILKLIEEDKKEEEVKAKKEEKDKLLKGPFAKFKNYNTASSKVSESKSEKTLEKKQKERNRFINVGKIRNFNFLQLPEKKKSIVFESEIKKGLFDNFSVQKEVFNYRDFKNRFFSNKVDITDT